MAKRLRYIEISHRNRMSRIFVGKGDGCSRVNVCGDICIDIERAGQDNCTGCCTSYSYHNTSCGCASSKCQCRSCCDKSVAHVCATEIDEEGYAVFEWSDDLLELKEGWYEGHIKTGCDSCGIIPLRVGPRCNVLEVETKISGPDDMCYVGCDDPCETSIYPMGCGKPNQQTTIYVPEYEC